MGIAIFLLAATIAAMVIWDIFERWPLDPAEDVHGGTATAWDRVMEVTDLRSRERTARLYSPERREQ